MSNIVMVVLAFIGVELDCVKQNDNSYCIDVHLGRNIALLAEVFPFDGGTFDLYAMNYGQVNARRMFSIHI